MKLFEVLQGLIKHDLRTNRGRKLKELVKAAAQKGNANANDKPDLSGSGYSMDIPKATDPGAIDGMF